MIASSGTDPQIWSALIGIVGAVVVVFISTVGMIMVGLSGWTLLTVVKILGRLTRLEEEIGAVKHMQGYEP